ncbi:hypothetical protein NDU88_004632 [Pleurodeles waltl]|uniref:Uncharacterized protein n=1 Tax=Pleurodeles waltl TaxID=8319 RepID=A0AAV7WWD7_PLEWA|nr:hypothetical protein NDU88_004632 [Pleurodeles waltl]
MRPHHSSATNAQVTNQVPDKAGKRSVIVGAAEITVHRQEDLASSESYGKRSRQSNSDDMAQDSSDLPDVTPQTAEDLI